MVSRTTLFEAVSVGVVCFVVFLLDLHESSVAEAEKAIIDTTRALRMGCLN
jgi:hypothetical protein